MMSIPTRNDDVSAWILLRANLNWVTQYVRDFGAAVVLAEHAREMQAESNVAHRWLNMAGRQGALSIHDFLVTIETLRACCEDQPAISAAMDTRQILAIEQAVQARFPFVKRTRAGAAHTADFIRDVDKMLAHAKQMGGGIQLSAGGHLGSDNIYRVTFRYRDTEQSKEYAYDLTRDALAFLVQLTTDLFAAFAPFHIPGSQ